MEQLSGCIGGEFRSDLVLAASSTFLFQAEKVLLSTFLIVDRDSMYFAQSSIIEYSKIASKNVLIINETIRI